MDENIITAAPPSTHCGIMDTSAASFGSKPQRIRNTAPHPNAKRFTIFVMVTSPTFWLKDVFGSTPKSAAKEDPIPSHITPPDSSESVASRPIPPSIQPEISPTVSTAVTINIIRTGRIARRSKTGFTGIICGTANHFACATLSQFSTHAFVYSTPSALTAVVGRKTARTAQIIYPAIIPKRIQEELVIPFVPCFRARMIIITTSAIRRFSIEP